jgi:hypothetical protein
MMGLKKQFTMGVMAAALGLTLIGGGTKMNDDSFCFE